MKKIFVLFYCLLVLIGCKSFFKDSNTGDFKLVNNSNKIVEFIWITHEGDFYPTVKSINLMKNQIYEVEGLNQGTYDIAIDFKGEYNSFNSKKNKDLCLTIDKGFTTVWTIEPSGSISR